jgi:hypothetical protein
VAEFLQNAHQTEQRAFLNVFANELGIVIEHKPTAKGPGEVPTAHDVVKNGDDLTGKIVLADAMHTNPQLIREIEKKTVRMSSVSKAIRKL